MHLVGQCEIRNTCCQWSLGHRASNYRAADLLNRAVNKPDVARKLLAVVGRGTCAAKANMNKKLQVASAVT
jgi:hypothetical protein